VGRRLTRSGDRGDLVSIVLCTYDRARLVRRAIRSVLAQRHTNWQLIIVDDGSTDQTPEVLAPLPLKDPRIIVIRQSNHGLPHARNRGLRRAAGTFITFLDSDDEYLPTHLSSRVAALRRSPRTDMLYGGLTVRGPRAKRYVADLERPGRKIHVRHCTVGGTFFMRRTIVDRGLLFRPVRFGEDLALFRRIGKRFRVRKVVGMRTYVYHCETPNRMCDVYTEELLGTAR